MLSVKRRRLNSQVDQHAPYFQLEPTPLQMVHSEIRYNHDVLHWSIHLPPILRETSYEPDIDMPMADESNTQTQSLHSTVSSSQSTKRKYIFDSTPKREFVCRLASSTSTYRTLRFRCSLCGTSLYPGPNLKESLRLHTLSIPRNMKRKLH